eukprot:UN15685
MCLFYHEFRRIYFQYCGLNYILTNIISIKKGDIS